MPSRIFRTLQKYENEAVKGPGICRSRYHVAKAVVMYHRRSMMAHSPRVPTALDGRYV